MTLEQLFNAKPEELSVGGLAIFGMVMLLRIAFVLAQGRFQTKADASKVTLASEQTFREFLGFFGKYMDDHSRQSDARTKLSEAQIKTMEAIEQKLTSIGGESLRKHDESHAITTKGFEAVTKTLTDIQAEFSELKAAVLTDIKDSKASRTKQIEKNAEIALRVSAVENLLGELNSKFFPSPSETQQIPPEIHEEARSLSTPPTTSVEGILLAMSTATTKDENGGDLAA
jgi:hypothetical protein